MNSCATYSASLHSVSAIFSTELVKPLSPKFYFYEPGQQGVALWSVTVQHAVNNNKCKVGQPSSNPGDFYKSVDFSGVSHFMVTVRGCTHWSTLQLQVDFFSIADHVIDCCLLRVKSMWSTVDILMLVSTGRILVK